MLLWHSIQVRRFHEAHVGVTGDCNSNIELRHEKMTLNGHILHCIAFSVLVLMFRSTVNKSDFIKIDNTDC